MKLSGGEHGGEEIAWQKDGLVEDGREFMLIGECAYVKVDEEVAVLYKD